MVNKWLNCRKQRQYVIQEQNGQYALCKVLNKYDTKEQAIKDLSRLVTNKCTEIELLKLRE